MPTTIFFQLFNTRNVADSRADEMVAVASRHFTYGRAALRISLSLTAPHDAVGERILPPTFFLIGLGSVLRPGSDNGSPAGMLMNHHSIARRCAQCLRTKDQWCGRFFWRDSHAAAVVRRETQGQTRLLSL